jgi:hypothetical protein
MLLPVVFCLTLIAEPEFRAPLCHDRYGRIIVEGNTDTPDGVIVEKLGFRPGMLIQFGELATARERLRRCGIFQTNPWRGEGPTIELLPNDFDSSFWDVRITVRERPGNWLVWGMTGLLEAAIVGPICLEPGRITDELDRFCRRATEEAVRPR